MVIPTTHDRHRWNVRALLTSVGTPFSVAHYRPDTVIFSQGDPCDSVIYVEKGRVRLSVTTPAGNEAICGLLSAGAFLGEDALSGYAARRVTATAMTAAEGLVIEKARMIRLLRTQPAISDRFIAHVLARNTRLEGDLANQLLNGCERRLALTLVALAGCDSHHVSGCALPAISQQIIAEMVGTTRSRVNRFMGKFRKLGLLEEDQGVLQVMPSMLHVVTEERAY